MNQISKEEIRHHQYYNQVVLDVKRILKRFPPGKLNLYCSKDKVSFCM